MRLKQSNTQHREAGATCVEYAIVLLLVAVVSLAGITHVGDATAQLLNNETLASALGGGTVTNE